MLNDKIRLEATYVQLQKACLCIQSGFRAEKEKKMSPQAFLP